MFEGETSFLSFKFLLSSCGQKCLCSHSCWVTIHLQGYGGNRDNTTEFQLRRKVCGFSSLHTHLGKEYAISDGQDL